MHAPTLRLCWGIFTMNMEMVSLEKGFPFSECGWREPFLCSVWQKICQEPREEEGLGQPICARYLKVETMLGGMGGIDSGEGTVFVLLQIIYW